MIWIGIIIGIMATLGFSYLCDRFVMWNKKQQEDKEFLAILNDSKPNE